MERIFRSLLLVALTTGLAACSLFSGEDEDVRVPTPLSDIKQTVQLQELWSGSVGEGVESGYEQLVPSVSGDKLYAVGARGMVTAFDIKTGKTDWRKKLEVNVGGGVTVDAGMILFGTLDGRVFALNETDGETLWSTRVSSEVLSLPQTNGQLVLVQTIDDVVTAIDAKNGKVFWSQENLQPALTLRGSSMPSISGEAVFVGLSSGEAKAFRLVDGAPLWESRVSTPRGASELERMVDIKAKPLIVGDTVFVVSFQGKVAALEMFTGRVKWSHDESSYHSMAEGFGSLYLTDSRSHISSVDQRTGSVSWRQDKLQYRRVTGPATYSSYLAVGDFEGYVHLLSQVDGTFAGRIKVGSAAIRSQPVVSGDLLFVVDANGKLFALKQR